MELWRARGYVPDSDDEEELNSQEWCKGGTELLQGTKDGQEGDGDAGEDLKSYEPQKEEVLDDAGDEDEADRHESQLVPPMPRTPLNLVAVEVPLFRRQEDYEDDPLQVGLRSQHPSSALSSTFKNAAHSPDEPDSTAPTAITAPSSPDELQMEDHFPPKQPPKTPLKSSTELQSKLDLNSPESSPLSSIPSTPQTPPHFDDDEPDNDITAPLDQPGEMLPPPALTDADIPSSLQPSGRFFRRRNPIQLHPYMLEDARYRTLFQQSGVRPIRVANTGESRPQNESQDQEFVDENVPPSSSPHAVFQLPSSPLELDYIPARPERSPGALRDSRQSGNARRSLGGENMMDMQQPSSNDYSNKRRKISHIYSAKGRIASTENRGADRLRVLDDNVSRQNGDIFDFPAPSPDDSAPPAIHGPPQFRIPRGISPSPAIIGADRAEGSQSFDPIHIRDASGPEVQPRPEIQEHSESEPESVQEGELDLPNLEILRMKRQIKGVLPASWLRLDLERQQGREEREKARKRREIEASRGRREGVRGVAQRIARRSTNSRNNTPSRTNVFLASDGESDVSSKNARNALAELMGFNDTEFDMDDDIPEDNRIDYMLPTVPRRQKQRSAQTDPRRKEPSLSGSHRGFQASSSHTSRKKRQSRITDSVGGSRHPRPAKPRSVKSRPPRLGILDAPDVREQPVQVQPQFLRVAARQARSRRDRGRKSPTRTYLRLGSKRDTEDANSSLRAWRAGTIQPTKLPSPNARRDGTRTLAAGRTGSGARRRTENSPLQQVPRDDGRLVPDTFVTNETPDQGDAGDPDVAMADNVSVVQEGSVQAASRTGQTKRPSKPWTIRRGYVISSMSRNAPRPAQLDFSNVGNHGRSSASSFQKSISALNSEYRASAPSTKHNVSLPLARFLTQNTPSPQLDARSQIATNIPETGPSPIARRPQKRQLKKRQPRRFDTEAAELRQPPSLGYDRADTISIRSDNFSVADSTSLQGLSPSGSIYTRDFNIIPLQRGTYFHTSTFVGSGEFAGSLNLLSRDLDNDCGQTVLQCDDKTYRWGPWNDSVSSEMGTIFDAIRSLLDSLVSTDTAAQLNLVPKLPGSLGIYRSVIAYVNSKLWFMDPVDRVLFIDRSLGLLSRITDGLALGTNKQFSDTAVAFHSNVESLNLVFANQVRQIASHHLVESSKTTEVATITEHCANRVLKMVSSSKGMSEIRKFLEDIQLQRIREAGVKDTHPFVEAFVIAQHILYGQHSLTLSAKDIMPTALLGSSFPQLPKDIRRLEKIWYNIFTILPLQAFDDLGIFVPGLKFEHHIDQWQAVKFLLSTVFDAYLTNPRLQPASFNNYCRALFHRCFNLINSWRWIHCKPILDTLFDFFAKNSLHNLVKEEAFGSPWFLDDLDKNPKLEVEPTDSCFHILLKVIGTGLRSMTKIYDKRKIRSFAWRLLPNHGRTYPKEEALREEDLEALRNHHDLLCTLYWATPDGCHPPIKTIRNLVHPLTSHIEASRVHIQAWFRLIKFELSTDEDASALAAFADWHSSFVVDMLDLHALARTEVEAQSGANSFFSRDLVESTVSKNQRQIESLLSMALTGLKVAVSSAKSIHQAKLLLEKLPFERLFNLFSPKVQRLGAVVCQVLDVVLAYMKLASPSNIPTPAVEPSEDSQEFGDWTAFAEIYDHQIIPSEGIMFLDDSIRPVLSRFVSNCFGEDDVPEDAVLSKVIECWVSVGASLVKNGLRQWSSYLNQYDGDSWTSLRLTRQTRGFTPHFLGQIVEKGALADTECKAQILNHWMTSIVERGSRLKFQHELTSSLLNEDKGNVLFENLAFSTDASGRYHITLDEFGQRRLSLISSVLSNMREHLESSGLSDSKLQSTSDEYRELVKTLMAAMKSNYEELGSQNEQSQGQYVDFVQRVVGFLQEHAQSICPIDEFFTDPSTFPLPAHDPQYIAARLKSYGARLSVGKVAKQLVMFVQNVSERAAVDGQQTYLVNQLYSAMSNTFEHGDVQQPTIRAFLLQCVFPAYVEISLNVTGAWILVRPICQSLTLMLPDLLTDMDACNGSSLSIVIDSIAVYFNAVCSSLRLLVDHPGLLEEPSVLFTVVSFLETVIASLALIDYLDRATDKASILVTYINIFKEFSLFAAASLLDPVSATAPDALENPPDNIATAAAPLWADARRFAARELQSWLKQACSTHHGKYFIRRGQQVKEIEVRPEYASVEDAKTVFVQTVEGFFGMMEGLDTFSS
ncbi:hypothetical protein AJ80_02466 [Polytolypa hystricis UAMH7299]|uniref:Uncharacterized protein n=1 Tax=Polytolypa hystricis (strain UAMH7299) TaxID=1447883 RepID=A0A2B7YRM4_POLH7|nr:hypothetical protein AJ80_02466 [Polytolypa hystricis UAMH7299]